MGEKRITTKEIYDLIDSRTSGLRGEMAEMRRENAKRFDGLDDRLGTLEKNRIPKLEIKQAILSTKVMFIITIVSVVASAVVSTIISGVAKALGGKS